MKLFEYKYLFLLLIWVFAFAKIACPSVKIAMHDGWNNLINSFNLLINNVIKWLWFFAILHTMCNIPLQSIHRIQNTGKKPIKIMEAQIGSILKETDIIRYQDFYGRV